MADRGNQHLPAPPQRTKATGEQGHVEVSDHGRTLEFNSREIKNL